MPPTTMHGVLDPARVCQVYDRGTKAFGTGYRIATRLVLTAHHVVEDAPHPDVRLSSRDWEPVERVWYDQQRDLALLEFRAEPPDAVEPVGLGRTDPAQGIDRVGIRALGFPHFVEFTADDGGAPLRPPHQAEGHLSPGSTMGGARMRVTLDDAPASFGPEEHWTGMSGAPVFGIDSGLLLGVFEMHLKNTGPGMHEIRGFDGLADPEWERLLEQAGVRLPPEPLLPDGWDRTRGKLVTHRVHLGRLANSQEAFVYDRLPFVTPQEQQGAHVSPEVVSPAGILDRLTRAVRPSGGRRAHRQPPAVLLVGPPGCGKTRFCREVANAAAASDDGWTVLHLTRSTPLDELEETVEGLAGRQVLLVLDDLDRVDLPPSGEFGGLLARAEQNGSSLALLGSARPSWMDRGGSEHTAVFHVVQVPAGAHHQARIQAEVLRRFAPRALDELGEQRLAQRCGLQPAIAVMLARLYEDEVQHGVPLDDADAEVRENWEFTQRVAALLRAADLLTPRVRSMDAESRPVSKRHVASAAVFATVPLTQSEALRSETTLLEVSEELHLVERLQDWGLLEKYGDQVRSVHDSIADEYLRHVLFDDDTPTARLRQSVFEHVLDAGRLSDAHLRNLIRNLERLGDTFPPGDRRAAALAEGVQRWWQGKADEIGTWLTEHASADTLMALLAGDLMRPADEDRQRTTVESWLVRNAPSHRAWKVIANIRAYDILPPDVLTQFAFSWVARHPTSRAAYVLLNHLLRDPAIDAPLHDGLVRIAEEWLAVHGLTRHAPFILGTLLSPSAGRQLPAERARALLEAAMRWLRSSRATEVTFLVRPLLDQQGLQGQALHDAVDILLDTCAPAEAVSTSYILTPLLDRMRAGGDRAGGDLLPDQSREIFSRCFAWLANHGEKRAAGHVLAALVAAPIPYNKTAHRALHLALTWLRDNPTDPQAGRLHNSLLKTHIELTEDDVDSLRELTPEWLDAQGTEHPSWPSVFAGAVRRRVLNPEDLCRLATAALDLYESRPSPQGVRNLMQPLLMEADLDGALSSRLLRLTWGVLGDNPGDPQNSYLLTSLFLGPYLPREAADDAVLATVTWLDRNPRDSSGIRLLSAALALDRVPAGSLDLLANRAVARLTPRTLRKRDGLRVLRTLCSRRAMFPPTWNRVVSRTCSVLRDATDGSGEVYDVLTILLKGGEGLNPAVLNELHGVCLGWVASLRSGYRPKTGSKVLRRVLEHPRLARKQAEDAVGIALRWMGPAPDAPAFGTVLSAALNLRGLPAELTGRVVDTGLEWLEHHAARDGAETVLAGVCRAALTDADAVRAGRFCAIWLSARTDDGSEEFRDIAQCRKRLVSRTAGLS